MVDLLPHRALESNDMNDGKTNLGHLEVVKKNAKRICKNVMGETCLLFNFYVQKFGIVLFGFPVLSIVNPK
jgi:hypothetical protein